MHTFMYRGEGLVPLHKAFGREHIAAKIHHLPLRYDEALNEYRWGYHYLPPAEQTPLLEALAIQNLYALHGLAPRVYGLALWRDRYGQMHPVQVTDDLGRCDWSQDRDAVHEVYLANCALGQELQIAVPGRDQGVQNVVDGKWVDFNGFHLTREFYSGLVERFYHGEQWGDRPYQSIIGSNGVDTCRNIETRIVDLGLDRLPETPRSVLDVGCSGGQFLHYLTQTYGARGTGYDTERAITAAAEYGMVTGAWNVDYHAADLRDPDAVTGRYDLVLFLSMSRHVGLPEYVKCCAAKRLIVELHHEHETDARAWLEPEFNIVKEQRSKDYGRLVLHAERRHE